MQSVVELQRMKAMNWWPCARLQDHLPRMLEITGQPETRNPFGTRRYIVCLYFCLICLGTESHIFHKTIPIRAVKTAIVFRHFNQRFVAFYNYIILHFDINNITFYNTIL